MALNKDKRGPSSFGDYLCLHDASSLIGARLADDWCDADLLCLSDKLESDAKDRAQRVRSILLGLLFGGQIPAFGMDDEGAYTELSRTRLSKPFFDIDIARSLFRWAPDDWAVIYVSRTGLKHHLAEISDMKPRKPITFDWQEITSKAWKLALDDPDLLKPSRLIGAVQDSFVAKYDGKPDEKELRGLVNEVIGHLSCRTLSREDFSPETPREGSHESE
ncbi:MAG: hypothetical protein ABL882_09300 [Sphingopyxis sp.]